VFRLRQWPKSDGETAEYAQPSKARAFSTFIRTLKHDALRSKNDDPHDLYIHSPWNLVLLRANWNTTIFKYVDTTRTERHLLPIGTSDPARG
jgi:hypothetical protein